MEYIRKAVESRETSLYDDIVAKIKRDITVQSRRTPIIKIQRRKTL